MRRLAILLISALSLAACGTTTKVVVPETKNVVVLPPDTMYDCPTDTAIPQTPDYTQADVSAMLLKLYDNNKHCKNSLDNIKQFLDRAKQIEDQKAK